MTRTHAWAVVDRDGKIVGWPARRSDHLAIWDEDLKEAADHHCRHDAGERVVRVVIEADE